MRSAACAGQYRMSQFGKQAQGSALTKVSDPALAAAIFFASANGDDVSLHLSEPVIGDQISRIVPDEERDEIMAYALLGSRQSGRRAPTSCGGFKPLWREKLTREERASLVTMAEAVASVGSGQITIRN